MPELVFLIILILIIVLLTVISIKMVNSEEIGVVERLGSYYQSLEPGVYFLIPLMDKMKLVKKNQVINVNLPFTYQTNCYSKLEIEVVSINVKTI